MNKHIKWHVMYIIMQFMQVVFGERNCFYFELMIKLGKKSQPITSLPYCYIGAIMLSNKGNCMSRGKNGFLAFVNIECIGFLA